MSTTLIIIVIIISLCVIYLFGKKIFAYIGNHLEFIPRMVIIFLIFISSIVTIFIIYLILHEVYVFLYPPETISIYNNTGNSETSITTLVLEILELLFLSTIPVLITTSIYRYYTLVLKKFFVTDPNDDNIETIPTLQSLINLSMTKFNFYAILVSTGIIIILKMANGKGEDVQAQQTNIAIIISTIIVCLLVFMYKLKHSLLEMVLKINELTIKDKDFEFRNRAAKLKFDTNDQIVKLNEQKSILRSEISTLEKNIANDSYNILRNENSGLKAKVETLDKEKANSLLQIEELNKEITELKNKTTNT